MNAEEFSSLLVDLGLTASGAARLLGVDRKDVVSWISGHVPPPPVVRFLLFLKSAGVKPEEVMAALSDISA